MSEPQTPAPDGSTPTPVPPSALVQPYPGAPPVPVGGYPPVVPNPRNPVPPPLPPQVGQGTPHPVDPRPTALAIIGFVLALVGIVMAIVPFLAWFAWLFLVAGLVLALIALISKKQGGKGLSIAALVISAVGWIVSIVVAVASFAFVGAFGDFFDAVRSDRHGSLSAPDAYENDPGDGSAALAPDVAEVAFGRETFDDATWWYVVILDNPNADYVFDLASIDIEAVGADGTILDTSTDYVSLLPGRTAIAGTFSSVGRGEIDSLDIALPHSSEGIAAPADETGSFAIDGLSPQTDAYNTVVTGNVSGTFATDTNAVKVVVVARAADGKIIGGTTTYVDRVPADGRKAQFEARFYDPLPADTTFEATATF